jgi:hypothetical protein
MSGFGLWSAVTGHRFSESPAERSTRATPLGLEREVQSGDKSPHSKELPGLWSAVTGHRFASAREPS